VTLCRVVCVAGPTFGAVCHISGTSQGQTVIYRENSYPLHAVGEVTFLWRPLSVGTSSSSGGTVRRQLWIWTHPACYADVLTELKSVFRLSEADCRSVPVISEIQHWDNEMVAGMQKRKKKNRKRSDGASCAKRAKLGDDGVVTVAAASQDGAECSLTSQQHTADCQSKLVEPLTDTTAASSSATYARDMNTESKNNNNGSTESTTMTVQQGDARLLSKMELVRNIYENGEVRLESLKDELCRFRLIGPKAHRVVVETFCLAEASCVDVSEDDAAAGGTDISPQVCTDLRHRWWDDHLVTEHGLAEAMHQAGSWKKVCEAQNSAELPPSSVHGLTVRDPRLFLPQRRTLASDSVCGEFIYSLISHTHTFIVFGSPEAGSTRNTI